MVQSHSDIPFHYLPYSGGTVAFAKCRILVWVLRALKENHQYISTWNVTTSLIYTMIKVKSGNDKMFSTRTQKMEEQWRTWDREGTSSMQQWHNSPDNYTSQKILVVTFWGSAEDSGGKKLQTLAIVLVWVYNASDILVNHKVISCIFT